MDQSRIEWIVLDALAAAEGPIGASRIAELLSEHGILLSEATAGRFLRGLDRRGLTRPVGKLGRLLTAEGRTRLKQLEVWQRQGEHSAVLVGAATPVDVDELIDLLYARRAVEPEAARHAALRATAEERAAIFAAADSHLHHVMGGTDHAQAALDFHRLVAAASHNKMLTAVAHLTLDPSNDALTTLLDFISGKAGAHFTFAHEHQDIVDAIMKRDPDRAEEGMRVHVDDLIRVVLQYRERFPQFSTTVSSFEHAASASPPQTEPLVRRGPQVRATAGLAS